MPYIAIKSFPKDQATKELVVDKIVKPEINPKKENMMILSGKKLYK